MSFQSSGPMSWAALNTAYGFSSNAMFSYSNVRNSTEGASFSNVSLSNIQNRSIPLPNTLSRRKFAETVGTFSSEATGNAIFNNTKGVISYVNSTALPAEDRFVCEYTGFIKLTENGTHYFYFNSDDGSELAINGSVVANWYGFHGQGIGPEGTVTLNAGVYSVRIRYQEATGGEALMLFYKGPSDAVFASMQNLPAARFCYNYKPYIKLDANHLAYNQGVSVNSAITTWNNTGTDGTAVNATGVSGNNQGNPTLRSDSAGYMVTFDRTKLQHFTMGTLTWDKFRSGDSLDINGLTMFVVARFQPNNLSAWERIIDFGNGNPNDNIIINRNNATTSLQVDVLSTGSTIGISKLTPNAMLDGAFHVYAIVVTNGAPAFMDHYIDGNNVTSTVTNIGTQANILNKTTIYNYIGKSNWSETDFFLSGDIREIQIFREVLATSIVQQMSKYLMYKWSINTDVAFITNGLIGYYTGESWTGTQWRDISSIGNHAVTIRGSPVNNAVTLNGLKCMSGGPTAGITFTTAIVPTGYTLFHVTKYNGASRNRIFDGLGTNWLSGFHLGKSGVAYHDNWITPQVDVHGTNWVVSTDQKDLYRSNRVQRSTTTGVTTSVQITINAGVYVSGESSDWACACVIVYNRTLSAAEIIQVEDYLYRKYNLP